MEFLSVKDSAAYTSKSESTIKRLVKEVQSSSKNKTQISKKIKFEPLKTGHRKTLISKDLLDDYFDISNGSTIQNDNLNSSNELFKDDNNLKIIDLITSQLKEKDKQIEQLNSQLKVKDEQIEKLNKSVNELIVSQQQSNAILFESGKSVKLLEQDSRRKSWWSFKSKNK
jgi:hypothetical protein